MTIDLQGTKNVMVGAPSVYLVGMVVMWQPFLMDSFALVALQRRRTADFERKELGFGDHFHRPSSFPSKSSYKKNQQRERA